MTRIAVVGLGYVGAVSVAGLAELGHRVTGIDIDAGKVSAVNAGVSPVAEPGLSELLDANRTLGRVRAVGEITPDLLSTTEVIFISVGTPSRANGAPNLEALDRVAERLGASLRDLPISPMIVLRSTTTPGTTMGRFRDLVVNAAGRAVGGDRFAYHPEFLREGSGVADFFSPPKTVVGADRESTAKAIISLYGDLGCPTFATSVGAAEFIKYADNTFHALKAGFANELAISATAAGVDVDDVFDLFLADTKLNVSTAYLRPGFAFGGSCLPKDVRALSQMARSHDITLPIVDAVLPSNDALIGDVTTLIEQQQVKRLLVLGLSFKPHTDDVRESPFLRIVEFALGRGVFVSIIDPDIDTTRLRGSNLRAAIHDNSRVLDCFTDAREALGDFDLTISAKTIVPEPEVTTAIHLDASLAGIESHGIDAATFLRPWHVNRINHGQIC